MGKRIGALIWKASDDEYEEFKSFNTWEEMIEYMKRTWPNWVVDFCDSCKYKGTCTTPKKVRGVLGEVDHIVLLTIHDDFLDT